MDNRDEVTIKVALSAWAGPAARRLRQGPGLRGAPAAGRPEWRMRPGRAATHVRIQTGAERTDLPDGVQL